MRFFAYLFSSIFYFFGVFCSIFECCISMQNTAKVCNLPVLGRYATHCKDMQSEKFCGRLVVFWVRLWVCVGRFISLAYSLENMHKIFRLDKPKYIINFALPPATVVGGLNLLNTYII